MTAALDRVDAAVGRYLVELGTVAVEAEMVLAQRDCVIAEAVRAGVSRRAVAGATGLTHPGFSKIVARVAGDSLDES
jgi:hypothetical protein